MTVHALSQLRRIQVLLNTLVGEHYVRRSLLAEVCDLLAASGRSLQATHRAALELLRSLEVDGATVDFDSGVQSLCRLFESAARPIGGESADAV